MSPPIELIELARWLGDPAHDCCIEAEGNVSARTPLGLWIKGSGARMAGIHADGFAHCRIEPVLAAVRSSESLSEAETRATLNGSKMDSGPLWPSTETFMHALLIAEGASYVAHSHPTPILSLLCRSDAEQFADKRLFPDEIVLLGPASSFVPYTAPGLPLARELAKRKAAFSSHFGVEPKTYLLENHGLIVVGQSAREVTAACAMAVKAARVLLGCLQSGAEPKFLSREEVDQIFRWPDEHARQRALWGVTERGL